MNILPELSNGELALFIVLAFAVVPGALMVIGLAIADHIKDSKERDEVLQMHDRWHGEAAEINRKGWLK